MHTFAEELPHTLSMDMENRLRALGEAPSQTTEVVPDVFHYLTIKGDERVEAVDAHILEREKALWEIEMVLVMLTGNPETGVHVERVEGQGVPCQCGPCEIRRDQKIRTGLIYAIKKLRELKATLT